MRIRKADEQAFNEAVLSALLAVQPQLVALRDVLPQAIFLTDCPGDLLDGVRKEVMNEIVRSLIAPSDESPTSRLDISFGSTRGTSTRGCRTSVSSAAGLALTVQRHSLR